MLKASFSIKYLIDLIMITIKLVVREETLRQSKWYFDTYFGRCQF